MQNFALLEKSSAVIMLTKCQKHLGKSYNAIIDSINLNRDHCEQNKICKEFLTGGAITLAAN